MADAVEEVSEMVSISNALVLNIGTLNAVQVRSMIKAGKRANDIEVPVILDPVGVGATRFRTEMALKIMNEVKISILKGNAGEIGVLAGTGGKVRGVDSEGTSSDVIQGSKVLAERSGSVVISSGATDVITDSEKTFLVDNGHNMMSSISGTGCMATSIIASFATVSEEHIRNVNSGIGGIRIAGERAAARSRGPFSFKNALFDEVLPWNLIAWTQWPR